MATSYENSISPVRQLVDVPMQKKVGNVSLTPVDSTQPVVDTSSAKPVYETPPFNPNVPDNGLGTPTTIPQSGEVITGKPTDTTPDYTGGPVTPPTKPVDDGLFPTTTPIPPILPGTTTPSTPTTSTTTTKTTAQQAMQQTQGLFDAAANATPKVPIVTPTAVPTTSVPSGYTPGPKNPATTQTTAPTVNYDPRAEALVQNQLAALMDPNSAVNRKAMAIAQQVSAQRGLQSSSIAAEAGTSALIDSARQIASQDASTYAQMQGQNQQYNQNWNLNKDNQQFQSGENELNRSHESQMFDKNAALQSSLLNTQLSFQAGENAAGRNFQAQMADLQHKQQLGLINAQQQSQLVQMERNSQLTTERDELLQKYNKELTVINNDQRWKETLFQADTQFQQLAKQFDQQTKLSYANSQTQIMSEMMAAIGQAMTNPNMTAAQQQATIDQIRSTFGQQATALSVIYGAGGTGGAGGTTPTAPLPGTNTGDPTTRPTVSTGEGLFTP